MDKEQKTKIIRKIYFLKTHFQTELMGLSVWLLSGPYYY